MLKNTVSTPLANIKYPFVDRINKGIHIIFQGIYGSLGKLTEHTSLCYNRMMRASSSCGGSGAGWKSEYPMATAHSGSQESGMGRKLRR